MPIPEFFQVDFSPHRRDLIRQGLDRLLGQHRNKCVLRGCVAVLLGQVQELFDALLDLQEKRTLYAAEGENLDALGRIVGEPRAPYRYDESRWMFADRPAQRPDNAGTWRLGAPFAAFTPVDDGQYRVNILSRIIKNHTLAASLPELERLVGLLANTTASYYKTGPMQAAIMLPSAISATAFNLLTAAASDRRVEQAYQVPYPATLSFSGTLIYAPDKFFCADRAGAQGCDGAACAVGLPLPGAAGLARPETGQNTAEQPQL